VTQAGDPRPLTDFEQILLGLICAHPSSGYDLKRAFAATPMGVYQPSSGALYPALRRLETKNLITGHDPTPATVGPRRRKVYEATPSGRGEHARWVRIPVEPRTVSADLGLHLMRFVMMEPLLSRGEVVAFLASLRDALAAFVDQLDRYSASGTGPSYHAALAVEHGRAIHQASLNWTRDAIRDLTTPARNRHHARQH
jgi:DNA-binding PadR family transcriptional regulator